VKTATPVKTATFSTAFASTVIAASLGMACCPTALADTTTTLGSQAELVDGAVV
jgi:hypothetical protein